LGRQLADDDDNPEEAAARDLGVCGCFDSE
jgi:hypothetical protein